MKVMIVEDEMLLAMELESEVKMASHEVIGTAMSRAQANALVKGHRPDFAFVYIHLQDGPTGIDIGRDLASKGIPYVFVSGNIKKIPPNFAGALGAIEKPYTTNGMKNALVYISAIISGQEDVDPPASLVLADDVQSMLHRQQSPRSTHLPSLDQDQASRR